VYSSEIWSVEIILANNDGSAAADRKRGGPASGVGQSERGGQWAGVAKLATNAARLFGRQTNGRNIIDHSAQAIVEFEAEGRCRGGTRRPVLSQIITPGI